jgi:hypothetical protein
MSQQHLTTGRVGTAAVGRVAAPGKSSPPLPFNRHSNAPSQWAGTYMLASPRSRPKYKSTALQHKEVGNVYRHRRQLRAVAT